jgi:uncharacterized peroxidase-related enzyme
VQAIVSDYASAPISMAERNILDFAVKLTRNRSSSREEDVALLRRLGWSDRAILDVTLIIAYFAFVNRIADGLGVELEEGIRGTP